jgi:hypothetical protein
MLCRGWLAGRCSTICVRPCSLEARSSRRTPCRVANS